MNGKIMPAVLIAVITAILTASGATLYRHEVSLLANAKAIERLRIEYYRTTVFLMERDIRQMDQGHRLLRSRSKELAQEDKTLSLTDEAMMDYYKEKRIEYSDKLENFVEEHKHMGEG